MSDHKGKLENFFKALTRLQEGILKYDPSNDLLRDGLIQRFEFTFELAWKTLKTCFEDEGLIGLNSPGDCQESCRVFFIKVSSDSLVGLSAT